MSITPAERRAYDDRLRQTREEYENREAEGLKQRNEEMRRLEKRHRDEVKNLTDDYDTRLGDTQSRNREILTDRDLKHQQDMDELRTMSRQQLRKKMEDSAHQRRELEEAYHADMEKQKTTSKSQHDDLSARQQEELDARDQHLEEVFAETRRRAQDGVEDTRRRLEEAHDKESNVVRQTHGESLAQKERDIRELKKSYEGQLKQLHRQKDESEARASERYTSTVENMKEGQDAEIASLREMLKSEVADEHAKFDQKVNDRLAEIDGNNGAFRESVTGRQDTQVRSRDSKIAALQSKLNSQTIQSKRQNEIEKKNLIRSYESRMEELERQKADVAEQSHDNGEERLNLAQKASSKVFNEATRQHRDEMNLINGRNREDREMLIATHRDQLAQNTKTTDKRIRVTERQADQQVKNMAEHYDESLEILKNGYAEKLEEQRDARIDDQARLTSVMTNRFRDLENKSQQRLDLTVETYENKLAVQKDSYEKELKRMETVYEQRLNEQKKGQKLEKESVEQKYEAKIAVADERHREEVDRLNRRHEEEIRNAVNRTASTFSRKA